MSDEHIDEFRAWAKSRGANNRDLDDLENRTCGVIAAEFAAWRAALSVVREHDDAAYKIKKLRDRLAVETLALVETLARAERAEQEAAALRLNDERYRRLREALTDIFYAPWDPADIAQAALEDKP
jgi:hypothetical protein